MSIVYISYTVAPVYLVAPAYQCWKRPGLRECLVVALIKLEIQGVEATSSPNTSTKS